jgi:trimeric autotransporter adhesin
LAAEELPEVYSLTDAPQRFNSVTEAQAAVITGASNAADYTFGLQGVTLTFTTATDDELEGTANDDVFIGTTSNIAATDAADGGAGYDVINITAVGALLAADLSAETINIDVQFFDTTTAFDMTNVDADIVNITGNLTGYSDTVNLTNGGDKEYTFSGVDTAVFSAYDEGVINTGSLDTLTFTTSSTEANIVVADSATVTLTDTAGAITDLNATINSGSTLDVVGTTATITGDIVITGAGTLRADQTLVSDASEIIAADATLRIDEVTTAAAFDLEDVNFGTVRVDTTSATDFSNAEGTNFTVTEDAASITVDTSTDGGSADVTVFADNTVLVAAGTDIDTLNVNLVGSVGNDNIQTITTDASVNVAVSGGSYTIGTIDETDTSALTTVTGDQDLTVDAGTVTTFDASSYTGDIDYTNVLTTASVVTTGSGDDTISAVDADITQTYILGAGADTLVADLWVGAAGQGLYVNLGAGDDTIDLNTAAFVAGSMVIVGGDGTDTIDLDAGAPLDFSAVSLSINEVEVISIDAAGYTFSASTLDGQTGLAINGTAADGEAVTVITATTDDSLDLSGVTYTNVDTSTITLTAVDDDFEATLTNMADTVAGPSTDGGFTINAGGGNDEVTLAVNGAGGGSGGTLTLGAGSDSIVLIADSTMVTDGAGDLTGDNNQASVAVLDEIVSVTDFDNANDSITLVSTGLIGTEVGAGAAVDVSFATTTTSDSFSAYVEDGVIILVGDDAANVDTLHEYVKVAALLAEDAGAAGAYLFEFNGNSYITDVTAAGVELATIELTGVTGLSLTLGGAADAITVV